MELFKNANDCLLFGLNYSTQQYAMSPMSKMLKGGGGSGKGLVALDGAGTAGIIKARIGRLSDLHRACVVARFAPRHEDCPCCENKKMTAQYKAALLGLAEWARPLIRDEVDSQRMRFGIVQSYFDRKSTVTQLAKSIGMPARTVHDQKGKIWPELVKLDKAAQEYVGDLLADLCGELPE